MTEKIMLRVTAPYHAADGSVIYGPGDLLEADAEVPQGVTYAKVIADVPDAPPAPEKPAAKAAKT